MRTTALRLIVYVSTSLIPPAYADRDITGLVLQSRHYNAQENISGALLYSEHRRFAQALEGEETAIGTIMARIQRDPRHANIIMVHDGPIGGRHFSGWSLAYRGHAPQIDVAIRDAEYEANLSSDRAMQELLRVMEYLATA